MSRVALAHAANLRELGGLYGADGRRIRRDALYRSGELATLRATRREALSRLGLRTIVDLRTDAEVRRRGRSPELFGARVVRVPMDSGDLTTSILPLVLRGRFEAVPPDLLEQVNRVLVREMASSLRTIFDVLLEADNAPVLFHCTHGKDRTGLVAALVLLALDVEWGAVVSDYLRSNDTRTVQHRRQRVAVRIVAPWLAGRPFGGADVRNLERLFDVVPENLEAARDEMHRVAGGVDAYLAQACGLTPERRGALRSLWLESTSRGG